MNKVAKLMLGKKKQEAIADFQLLLKRRSKFLPFPPGVSACSSMICNFSLSSFLRFVSLILKTKSHVVEMTAAGVYVAIFIPAVWYTASLGGIWDIRSRPGLFYEVKQHVIMYDAKFHSIHSSFVIVFLAQT